MTNDIGFFPCRKGEVAVYMTRLEVSFSYLLYRKVEWAKTYLHTQDAILHQESFAYACFVISWLLLYEVVVEDTAR